MLHAICRPPIEQKHMVNQYYAAELLSDARQKHQLRKDNNSKIQ